MVYKLPSIKYFVTAAQMEAQITLGILSAKSREKRSGFSEEVNDN